MEVTPLPISEITNVKGDPDVYGGGTAVPIGVSPSAQYTMEAANAQAVANRYFTEQHHANVNSVLDTVGKIDLSDVLPADQADINNNYVAMMKDMADNYRVLSDPASNTQKYGEFKQRLAGLQAQIATSKAHNAIYQANQKDLLQHPDLNTSENHQAMQSFTNTPMSQRKNFLLKAPTTFDPAAASKIALAATKKVTDNETLSKGGTYIIGQKGEAYDPDLYYKNWTAAINSHTDAYGNTDLANLQKIYDKMPADANGDKPSFDDYLHGVAMGSLEQGKSAVTIKPNEAQIAANKLGEEYWAERLNNRAALARIAQEDRALKAGQVKPEEGAEDKALLLYNAVHGKGVAPEFGQNIYGSDPDQDITVTTGGSLVLDKDGKATGETSPVVKQKIPAKQYVSLVPDNRGGFLLNTVKNSLEGGKLVSKPEQEPVTFEQASSDFNGLYGRKTAPQIASGTSMFNKKKLNTPNPTIDDLDKYFGKPIAATAAPAQPTADDPLGIRTKK